MPAASLTAILPRRSLVALRALVAALPLAACGGSEGATPHAPPSTPAARAEAAQKAADSRDSTILGHMPPGTFGPHLIMDRGHRLAVWAIGSGARQGFYTLALPKDRAPGAALRLGDALPGLELFRARPDGTVGFVLVTSRRAGEHVVLEARQLGVDGTLRGGPRVVAETPADVVWLDAVPTSRGVLVVWAEKNGEQADVYAVPLGALGIEASPRRHVRGALAWQIARFGSAAALATVEAGPKDRDVVVRFLGDDGQSVGPAVKVAEGVNAELDLDLAVEKDRTLIGFSERFGFERRLMLAELDQSGALHQAAQPATLPRGDQSLVALVGAPSSSDVFAIWEESRKAPLSGRRLELGRVDESARLSAGPATSLEIAADPVLPAFAVTPSGLAVAARSRSCAAGVSPEQCRKAEPVPALTFLDRDLAARRTTPVVLKPFNDAAPDLVWDFGLEGESLWALAARNEDPAPVLLQRFGLPQAGALTTIGAPALPRVRADQGVLEVPDLVDFEVSQSGTLTDITWLSYFDPNTPYVKPTTPAPDGKREPVRAILRIESLLGVGDEAATALPTKTDRGKHPDCAKSRSCPPESEWGNTISYRAHSLGGLAGAESEVGERLLAWSALDAGQPEAFITLLDQMGQKTKQKMLTHVRGDVTDVAVASVDGGWVVAWVDGRNDASEVYAVRLDGRLEIVGKEQALTAGAVNPTGVQLLTRGERVLVAWSDARGASRPGYADIYLAALGAKDGAMLAAPLKLASTELHSYAPVLAARGDGAAIGFIEGEPDVENSRSGALFMAELDAEGRVLAAPTRLVLPGRPSSLALACNGVCKVATTLDAERRSELWGVTFAKTAFGSPELLSVLSLPPDEAVPPVFVGDALFYVDALTGGERLIRRLSAVWR